MLEQWPGMTKQAKEKQDFANRMYLIPKELGVVVKRRELRDGVLELWRKWHEEKRGGALVLEGDGKEGEGRKAVEYGGEEKEVGKKKLEPGMEELEKGMENLKKG